MRRALHPADAARRRDARRGRSPLGLILILVPLLIVAICFAHASAA